MDRQLTRNDLVSFLNTVTRPGFQVDGIDDDTNLIDAGVIDSLALIQIIFYLEQNHDLHLQSLGNLRSLASRIPKEHGAADLPEVGMPDLE